MLSSQESFIERHVRKQLEFDGYSLSQIETGIDEALNSYRQSRAHSNGQLFKTCLDAAKAKLGKAGCKKFKVKK
ncbi:hypothetical protein CU052_13345 [Vibrio harveyi]|uniref:hypothetical protein n=1 Tax=Vibrio harveyi TaxID=669 RepID=UPI000C7D06F2|nr:hypothetical protein [Vibrio harveyi]AWB00218.1 hypothetical protein CU052_13345 [Vibrio harveyi]